MSYRTVKSLQNKKQQRGAGYIWLLACDPGVLLRHSWFVVLRLVGPVWAVLTGSGPNPSLLESRLYSLVQAHILPCWRVSVLCLRAVRWQQVLPAIGPVSGVPVSTEAAKGKGAAHWSTSASHAHVMLCMCRNVQQFLLIAASSSPFHCYSPSAPLPEACTHAFRTLRTAYMHTWKMLWGATRL